MDELLEIGTLASLSGLTVAALRHHDLGSSSRPRWTPDVVRAVPPGPGRDVFGQA